MTFVELTVEHDIIILNKECGLKHPQLHVFVNLSQVTIITQHTA